MFPAVCTACWWLIKDASYRTLFFTAAAFDRFFECHNMRIESGKQQERWKFKPNAVQTHGY